MPQQSDTMTEGTLVAWNVKEGDKYAEGDVVAEIETDKATMEMEGPDEPGTIAAILVKEGQQVPVGTVLATIALEGEDVEEVKESAGSGKKAAASDGADTAGKDHAPATTTTAEEEPAGGRKARDGDTGKQEGGQTRKPADVDYGGPQRVEMDMPAATEGAHESNGHSERVKASPLARRIAENKGIDLSQLQGSGPGGRIVQKDVLSFEGKAPRAGAEAPDQPKKPSAPALPQRVASGQTETVELSKMRLTIAKRLQQSKQNLPHFYETIDIELDAAEALRSRLNETLEKEGIRLSIGDLIAKAVAVTLKAYPVLNSTFDGTKLTRHGDVHLGMAVALDNGLIVPVLKNIDQMGFREIRLRSKELVAKARAQKLKGEEMTGATFTVSNLGAFGIREFVAIINPPEVGILAIGAGQKKAVVAEDGNIVARTVMAVTLSADHRVVDGADSARFLATLKQMLEEPGMMLV
jgi:pyruvate dehydrogenase E2 component (dihydrolipoamide acetyltransferase)